jgi:putative transposase
LPRANAPEAHKPKFVPGCIWHLTHRCHEREFPLKFARDREEYIGWMLEAKKRFDLTILNDMITSNHVHLLVEGGGDREGIPRSMQMKSGPHGAAV